MLSSIASFVAEIQTQKSHRDEREQGGPTVEPTSKKLKVSDANTNILSSHFVSLACLLWLSRMVDQLDPPSLEEDDIDQ